MGELSTTVSFHRFPYDAVSGCVEADVAFVIIPLLIALGYPIVLIVNKISTLGCIIDVHSQCIGRLFRSVLHQ